MAGEIWAGVNSVNQKIIGVYEGISGVNQKITEIYRGINGISQLVFSSGIDAQYSISTTGEYPVKNVSWDGGWIQVSTQSTDVDGVTYIAGLQFLISFATPIEISSLSCLVNFSMSSSSTSGYGSVGALYGSTSESSGNQAILVSGGLVLPYTFSDVVGQQCTGIYMSLYNIWGVGYIESQNSTWTINGTEYAISIPENTPENLPFILEAQ